MTKGFLIFAQNNPDIDYCKLAVYCAKRIKLYMDLPVSIVTDSPEWLKESQPDADVVFDKIITFYSTMTQTKKFHDGSMFSKKLEWKNLSRVDAYELTPYDQTIVLDSDYIVSTNFLSKLFDSDSDIMLFRKSYDLAQWRDTTSFEFINKSIPFYWATVLYFTKSKEAKLLFTIVKLIRDNWQYYRSLYRIDSSMYRNDYAFSLAIHIINGNIDFNSIGTIPGIKFYTLDKDLLIEVKNSTLKFLVEKEKYHGEYIVTQTNNVDVHVMNKYSLARIIE
jgi:hypothetical protein